MRDSYKRSLGIIYAFILITGISCVPRKLIAQSFLQSWSHDSQLSLEWYHPSFSGSAYSALSGIGFVSMNFYIGKNLQIKADLPLIYPKLINSYSHGSQLSPGNLYLGIEKYSQNSPFSYDVGVRLGSSRMNFPVFNENSDFYRYSAASYETWALSANGHYIKHLPSGLSYQFLLGSFATIPNQGNGQNNWYLNYGGHFRYDYHNLLIGAGFKGIAILTGAFLTSQANGKITKSHLSHHFYLDFGAILGNWTPSVYMALPLDHYIPGSGQLKYILGFRVNIHLPALD